MSDLKLYALGHRGDWFGKVRLVNGVRNVHRGTDFNGWDAGTPIPTWTAGTVAKFGWSSVLGNYVIIRRADGLYAGFHHMASFLLGLRVGQVFAVGDTIGTLGTTGTASTGPHLHATLARSSVVGGDDVIDPLPYIDSAVYQGGGSTPIGDTMAFDKAEKDHLDAVGSAIVGQVQQSLVNIRDQLSRSLPTYVWDYGLAHPLLAPNPDGSPRKVAAGTFLASEPAEHAGTRAAVALVTTGDIDYKRLTDELAAKYPQLDAHTIAVAAADEQDRRERERLEEKP